MDELAERPEILVAEDEGLVALNLQRLLGRLGYSVPVTVASAEEAVAAAGERHPALVLMDIMLKGELDGIEAAGRIWTEFNIPVVFLTSYTDDRTMRRASTTQSYGYLLKPFQPALLKTTIDMALAKHRMEQQLHERKEWLDKTLGSIGDGVIATDLQGLVLFLNPVAERLTGWPQAEALGQPLAAIFRLSAEGGEGRQALDVGEILCRREGVPIAETTLLTSREGGEVPITLTASPILDRGGLPGGVVIVFRDMSRVCELEQQLRHSQKMQAISTLAGGIAHDFNNLLSAIQGYAEISLLLTPEGSPLQNHLGEILRAAGRGSALVRQILTFGRQGEERKRPLRLQPILSEALQLLAAILPPTIETRLDTEGATGTVLADSSQIHQVVMNLCTNAYQAMRDRGGLLEVILRREEVRPEGAEGVDGSAGGKEYLKLTIRDTGQGMDPATLARIFEPYFTTKMVGEGTGLGLSVVHGIVQGCGGFIRVQSRPGEGTRFEVFFPCLDRPETAETEAQAAPVSGHEHILFVDDEAPIAEMVRLMLEQIGYRVTSLTDGQRALEAFARDPGVFDLVITDQTMPGMTGCELAARLIRLRPGIPVILATGVGEATIPGSARDQGISHFIRKPFTSREFFAAIRRVLEENKAGANPLPCPTEKATCSQTKAS